MRPPDILTDMLTCQQCLHLAHPNRRCDDCKHDSSPVEPGGVYVALLDTPPDGPGWTRLGDLVPGGYSIGFDVGPDDDVAVIATRRPSHVEMAFHVTRDIARMFGVPWRLLRLRNGPPPLAPGCLPRVHRARRYR